MSYSKYSNKRIYNDVLVPEKSCNARMVEFGASSGTTDVGSYQATQSIFFNNIQPLGSKGARNFYINGEFDVKFKYTGATENKGIYQIEFMKNPLWAMSCLVSINGGVSSEYPLGVLYSIYQNYSDKYKSYISKQIQSYYDNPIISHKHTTGTTGEVTGKIHFSMPLCHPFLMGVIGQVSSLNVRINTSNGFYSLFNTFKGRAEGDNVDPSGTFSEVKVSLSKCTITYEEFDVVDSDFSNEFDYFVVYQKQYGPNQITQSSDTRNTSAVPNNVFIMSAPNSDLFTTFKSDNTTRVLPITGLSIDLQNNINAYNASTQQEIYSRCKANDFKGEYSDFCELNDNNEFGAIIRYPMRDAPVDILTNDIFRCNVRDVNIKTAKDYATLYTIYHFKAILHLSLTGGANTIEYTKPLSEAFIGDVDDGDVDDDLVGGFSFGSFGKKLLNGAKSFIKNGGVSKLINTAQAVSNIVNPNGSKFQDGLDKANQISQALGLSSSIF